MKKTNNIKLIGETCTGCGTCYSLCPNEAIQLNIDKKKGIYLPELDKNRCNHCGICIKVCPSNDLNKFNKHNKFQNNDINNIIGNYLDCYMGYSKDYDIRYNSASGGIVTQLLISALEERIIDGAIIVRMKNDKPLEAESFIARTKEDIVSARCSKYCPVPVNIILRNIRDIKGKEKFAFVGLPCHIQGLKNAQLMNTKLRESITICIGIMCSHTVNFLGTEFLLKKFGIKKDDVRKLEYRGEGWPGSMKITLENNRTILIPLLDYWSNLFSLYFFTPIKCISCNDGICKLADISCGDAWLPELLNDKIGTSVIITKSDQGKRLLQAVNSKNKIICSKIDIKKIIQSQMIMLYLKNTRNYLLTLFPYMNIYISSSFLARVMILIPDKLVRLYGVPYGLLITRKAKEYFNIIE